MNLNDIKNSENSNEAKIRGLSFREFEKRKYLCNI